MQLFFSRAALILFVARQAKVSEACDCIYPPGFDKSNATMAVPFFFPLSETIFWGTVDSVTKVHGNEPNFDDEFNSGRWMAEFSVLQVWKNQRGVDLSEMTVYTMPNSALCGVTFTLGQVYIVYSREDLEGEFGQETSFCGRLVSNQNDPDAIQKEIAALDEHVTMEMMEALTESMPLESETIATTRRHICASSFSDAKTKCSNKSGDCSDGGDIRCGQLSNKNTKKHCFVVDCPTKPKGQKTIRHRFL